VLTPVSGEAATTWWPRVRSRLTSFDPTRPLPPTTTIFMSQPRPVEIATVAIERTELAGYPAGRPCSGLEFRLNFA
jgi:hypothetical protein